MTEVLRYTLVVRHPDTDAATPLLAGTAVPDWATDLVHPDDLTGAETIAVVPSTDGFTAALGEVVDSSAAEVDARPYTEWTKPELTSEVKARNAERKTDDVDYIVVDAPGNKPELIAALEADDQVED